MYNFLRQRLETITFLKHHNTLKTRLSPSFSLPKVGRRGKERERKRLDQHDKVNSPWWQGPGTPSAVRSQGKWAHWAGLLEEGFLEGVGLEMEYKSKYRCEEEETRKFFRSREYNVFQYGLFRDAHYKLDLETTFCPYPPLKRTRLCESE